MSVLALISDLMMQSQVTSAAARVGAELTVVASEDQIAERAAEQEPALVIVDLSHPGIDAGAVMDRLAPLLPPGAKTLAFGPHVHQARLAAAKAAGFDHVVSRGQFHAEMEAILRAHATDVRLETDRSSDGLAG